MKKIPNLDSIRFYGAGFVFIQHFEEILNIYGYHNYFYKKQILNLGSIGVTMFFTLSGFLISYILFNEFKAKGKINFKNFYRNRILRIWPLYLLTIIIYRIILPLVYHDYDLITQHLGHNNEVYKSIVHVSTTAEWILIIFLLPHVLLALGKAFFPAFLWSIGVEEVFYLMWPRFIKIKNFLRSIIVVLIVYLTLYYVSSYIWLFSKQKNELVQNISQFASLFLYMQRISCMVIGSIFAYLYLFKKNTVLHNKINLLYYLSVGTLGIILLLGIYLPFIVNELIAVAVAVIILFLSLTSKLNVLNKVLFNKISNGLGKYTYGIYMYHTLAIICAVQICSKIESDHRITIYLLSMFLTLLFSYVSYRYFEKSFLKLKSRTVKLKPAV